MISFLKILAKEENNLVIHVMIFLHVKKPLENMVRVSYTAKTYGDLRNDEV